MSLFDRLAKFFGWSRGKENGLSLPEEKGIEISHTRKERHAGFDEQPKETLTRWRLEAITGPEQEIPFVPSEPSNWPDQASREAETYLKERKGIQIPWHYGDKFGDRFRVIGLRAGGIGAVFFVEDTQFEKRVYAAKTLQHFLREDYLEKPTYWQKQIADAFLEEAVPWLEMGQHTNIVPVHLLKNIIHPTARRNVPFVFSEFMEKGDLRNLVIEKERLLEETIIIGLQICEGLIHAYKHGLSAHKDLKPDNIMVYKDGIYKVTDFSADVIGTPGYMAPEQVIAFYKNHGIKIVPYDLPIDHHADQFAISLIMYDVFKGNPKTEWKKRKDYIGSDPKRFVKEGIKGILSNDLPVCLKGIIARCLQPKIEDRFDDISSLKKELLRAYKDEFKKEYQFPKVEIDDSPIWWFNRGVSFYRIGRYVKAKENFEGALKKDNSDLAEGICLLNLGSVCVQLAEYAEAENYLKQALNKFQSIPGTEYEQLLCFQNLASLYVASEQFDKAKTNIKKALLQDFKSKSDQIQQEAIRLLNTLALLYERTGDFIDAISYYQYLLEKLEHRRGAECWQARVMTNLGHALWRAGRLSEAENYLKGALNKLEPIPGTEIEQGHCLNNLGLVYRDLKEFYKAETYTNKGLEIFRAMPGAELEEAKCLVNLGSIYRMRSQYNKAIETLNCALRKLKAIQNTEIWQGQCLLGLGNAHLHVNQFTQAEKYFKKAIRKFESAGLQIELAESWLNMGVVCMYTGRFSEAEDYYNNALKKLEDFPGTEIRQAICLTNLSQLYMKTQRFFEARDFAEKALEICSRYPAGTEEVQDTCAKILEELSSLKRLSGSETISIEQARQLIGLGTALAMAGQFSESVDILENALSMLKTTRGTEIEQATCFLNLGNAYNDVGDFQKAEDYLNQALKMFKYVGKKDSQARCLLNLGILYADRGLFGKAENCLNDALKKFRTLSGTEIEQARCLLNLGSIYVETKQFVKGEECLNNALWLFKSMPQTELEQAKCLANLGNAYLETGKFSTAETLYKEALEIYSSLSIPEALISKAKCLLSLGTLYAKKKEFFKCQLALEGALQICDKYPLSTEKIKNACLDLLNQLPKGKK